MDASQQLRASLDQLRSQLAQASSIEPAVAARLRETIADVERAIEGLPLKKPGTPSLADRLSGAALDFEASHPTLSGTLGSVIDALGRMGI
jgi:hypothetical protein